MAIVTRFAPSPTGDLHLGGVRTALFNYALARRHGGKFLLRIEDTDADRNSEASRQNIIEALTWLRLDWDGPIEVQSENRDRHRAALDRLISLDLAYPAFETSAELDDLRKTGGKDWIYNGRSRNLSRSVARQFIEDGMPHVWRLRTADEGEITVNDGIRGPITNRLDLISDPVIWRSNGNAPLYNFACTIDDANSGVTHVIRGEEHLGNAAIQTLILRALGKPEPVWAHLPIVTRGGKKMSKRDKVDAENGPVGVLGRRDLGWTAEGILNHLALLGWSRPDASAPETFGLDQFIAEFDLDRVRKSPSNFDETRARNMQKTWIRLLPAERLIAPVQEILRQSNPAAEVTPQHIALAQEKSPDLRSLADMIRFTQGRIAISDDLLNILSQTGPDTLRAAAHFLERHHDSFTWDDLLGAMRAVSPDISPRDAALGLRIALTGAKISPDLIASIQALGAEESVARLHSAILDVTPLPDPAG